MIINNNDMKRFWRKVNISQNYEKDCWEWTAAVSKWGYGIFNLNRTTVLSHRLIFIYYNGEIQNNLLVRHKCDNPKCVNLFHLLLGTDKDNAQDRVERGRQPSHIGDDNPNSKIKKKDILEMCEKIRLGEVNSTFEISEYFNLKQGLITKIFTKQLWKNITDEIEDFEDLKSRVVRKVLDDKMKNEIMEYLKLGFTIKQTSEYFKIGTTTVNVVKKQFREYYNI